VFNILFILFILSKTNAISNDLGTGTTCAAGTQAELA
jgi:hypothetical protein